MTATIQSDGLFVKTTVYALNLVLIWDMVHYWKTDRKCPGFPEIAVERFQESGGNKQKIQNTPTRTSGMSGKFGKVTIPLLLREPRPSTTPFHCTLFWVVFSRSFHPVTVFL